MEMALVKSLQYHNSCLNYLGIAIGLFERLLKTSKKLKTTLYEVEKTVARRSVSATLLLLLKYQYGSKWFLKASALWIRIGCNADLDPAFYRIQIRIQWAKPMGISADPDPGQTLMSLTVEILHEKYTVLKVGTVIGKKKKVQKPF